MDVILTLSEVSLAHARMVATSPTALAELSTATDKARRDAPSIGVIET
jgi:hypothetical protein